MKETVKALAVHSRPLAKCLAAAKYIKGGESSRKARQVLETFVDAGKRTDRRYLRRLTLDMFFSTFYYQISMKEYFYYQFEGKTDAERRAYIGCTEKEKLCAEIGDAKIKGLWPINMRAMSFSKSFLAGT